jgi:hypothetical protein
MPNLYNYEILKKEENKMCLYRNAFDPKIKETKIPPKHPFNVGYGTD